MTRVVEVGEVSGGDRLHNHKPTEFWWGGQWEHH